MNTIDEIYDELPKVLGRTLMVNERNGTFIFKKVLRASAIEDVKKYQKNLNKIMDNKNEQDVNGYLAWKILIEYIKQKFNLSDDEINSRREVG